MSNKTSHIVYGNRPKQIDCFDTLKRTDDICVDRIFTPDSPFVLRTIQRIDNRTYVRYIYFCDITSMFNTIDFFVNNINLLDFV